MLKHSDDNRTELHFQDAPQDQGAPGPEEAGLTALADEDAADVDADSALAMSGAADDLPREPSTLDIDSGVVEKIVAITCRSVDGILQMKGNFISSIQEGFGGTDITKGVQVEMVGDSACVVGVSIIMEYGKSAQKIFAELRDRVTQTVGDMTGLAVRSVKVRVVDVMTREEVDARRPRPKQCRDEQAHADQAHAEQNGEQGHADQAGEAEAREPQQL